MLYATVRNRKISVKKPTTVPCNGKGVDFLTLDLDEEWNDIDTILCTFTNDYQTEKKQKKTVTVTTVTTTKKKGEEIVETSETSDTETVFADAVEGDEEKANTETTEKTDTVTDGETTTVTVTKTTTTKSVVTISEAAKEEADVYYSTSEPTAIPSICVSHVGNLSVYLTGYDSEGNVVLTTAVPDSFWELVENGEPSQKFTEEEAATIQAQAQAILGEADNAAKDALSLSQTLATQAASGKFNGKNGKDGVTPTIRIGSVETVASGENADVTVTGTQENVVLNFKLPRGKEGTNTPVKGVDYWTEADKQEIVNEALAMLPNGDEVSY